MACLTSFSIGLTLAIGIAVAALLQLTGPALAPLGYYRLLIFFVGLLGICIFAGVPICQIFYHELTGAFQEYDSKYQHNRDIQPSLLFKELNPDSEKDPQLKLNFGMERSHR